MKKVLLLLLLICLSFTSCLSTKKVTGSIYKSRDKFQQCDFYMNKNPLYKNKCMNIYLVEDTFNLNYVRVVFTYSGSDWIFFDRAIILNNKDETVNFDINISDINRDVISHDKVKETADFVISNEKARVLKDVLDNGFVRLRLQGKKTKTYILKTKGYVDLLNYYFEEM